MPPTIDETVLTPSKSRANPLVPPIQAASKPKALRFSAILLIGAALYFGVGSYKLTLSKDPFIDEGWFAVPAYNLAFHGFMGSSTITPRGTWLMGELKGIQQYTYWVMPLDLVTLAGWFRVFGFGLIQMRLLSTLWAILALVSWYFIVESIASSTLAASLTVFLLALDFTFVWYAADGRMDMMCMALGSAGLASYLLLRGRSVRAALLGATSFTAASLFTHPNGVGWALFLGVVVLIYDRRQLRLSNLLLSGIPYAAFLGGWGVYIAKHPDYFVAQFSANSHTPFGGRGRGFLHPFKTFHEEIGRYIYHYSTFVLARGVPSYAIFIPILFAVISLLAMVRYLRCREKELGVILLLLVSCFVFLTLFDPNKYAHYLVMILPFYAAVTAVWLCRGAFTSRSAYLRLVPVATLLFVQVAVLQTLLLSNAMRDAYDPTIAFLKTMPTARIMGDSTFAFGLGFDGRLTDDMRLGRYSGIKPDLVVADRDYYYDWRHVFSPFDHSSAVYIQNLLDHNYHRVFGRDWYAVYQRNDFDPTSSENEPKASPNTRAEVTTR